MPSLAAQIFSAGAVVGEVDKPVVDATGLDGGFDFTIEYRPGGFLNALREQLGLKLLLAKRPIRIPVMDRVERPSEQ